MTEMYEMVELTQCSCNNCNNFPYVLVYHSIRLELLRSYCNVVVVVVCSFIIFSDLMFSVVATVTEASEGFILFSTN